MCCSYPVHFPPNGFVHSGFGPPNPTPHPHPNLTRNPRNFLHNINVRTYGYLYILSSQSFFVSFHLYTFSIFSFFWTFDQMTIFERF
ncbi:hypothetical protein BYT27DRAFT_6438607 [Phlegmacium glaucopus]|nr:hypothetical protein BYT27DRAFT_6438607 [Phlegmacium glaucopus]